MTGFFIFTTSCFTCSLNTELLNTRHAGNNPAFIPKVHGSAGTVVCASTPLTEAY